MWTRFPNVSLSGIETVFKDNKLRITADLLANGEFEVALCLKNLMPNGETRFASIARKTTEGSNMISIEVPLEEGGVHTVYTSIHGSLGADENMRELFAMQPETFEVATECNGLIVESSTVAIVDGKVMVNAAVKRTRSNAPRFASLVVRDCTLGLATTIAKVLEDDVTVIGLEAPLAPGIHELSCGIAIDLEGELTEIIAFTPKRV